MENNNEPLIRILRSVIRFSVRCLAIMRKDELPQTEVG